MQVQPQIVLETERLFLKELTNEVMQFAMTEMAKSETMDFLGMQTEAELEKEIDNFRKGYSWYRAVARNFILVDKINDITLGRLGFHTWYQAHARAEIGYHIAREENKRRGYMSEALKCVLHHGFTEMKLNRVEAFVGPANEASQRLLKGFGFVEEGRLRSHYCKNGFAEDSLCFGLLRSEWEVL